MSSITKLLVFSWRCGAHVHVCACVMHILLLSVIHARVMII